MRLNLEISSIVPSLRHIMSVWLSLTSRTDVSTLLSNTEFWCGTILVIIACEMDLLYLEILNIFYFDNMLSS